MTRKETLKNKIAMIGSGKSAPFYLLTEKILIKNYDNMKIDSAGTCMIPYYENHVPTKVLVTTSSISTTIKIDIKQKPSTKQYFLQCDDLKNMTIGICIIYIRYQ